MLTFIAGFIVGAIAIKMVPQETENRLRQAILTKWQKITKKG
jgi:hypothetical protein